MTASADFDMVADPDELGPWARGEIAVVCPACSKIHEISLRALDDHPGLTCCSGDGAVLVLGLAG